MKENPDFTVVKVHGNVVRIRYFSRELRRLPMFASFFRGTQTVRDKCYVTHWGVGVSAFSEKKRYEGVRFNVISIMRWWVGVKFPEKKRYVRMSPKRGEEGLQLLHVRYR